MLGVWTLATALLPVLMVVAMGVTVGRVPPATAAGLDSPAGRGLIDALVATAILFVLVLVTAPVKEVLSAVIKVRLTYAMQQRLIASVSAPTGIEHLEDPAVLDKLALARGSLLTYFPADAPVLYATVVANLLAGLGACVVIGVFRWWLGVLLFVFWRIARRPFRRDLLNVVRSFGGEADVMRRSEYLRLLATRPAAAKELRVFGIADWVIDAFRVQWFAGMRTVWDLMTRLRGTMIRVSIGVLVVYGFTSYVISDAVLDHRIGLGMLAAVLPLLMSASSVGTITYDDVALEFTAASLPHLDDLEDSLQEPNRAASVDPMPVGRLPERDVAFSHLAFRYPGATTDVFTDLDLVLPAGSSTAIVGPNGVGKTTFVKLLAGLHAPTGGEIVVDGTPLTELSPVEWQRNVAVVFQDFIHYPLTAADNVGFGAIEHRDDLDGRIRAARRAGALATIDALPNGWDTVLAREYDGGVDLSGGQWQRLALARALFAAEHGARVLVLDEPTAWLDARGEAEFFDRFLEITHGLTTVVISHRFSTVRRAEHIVVVEHGAVAEQGSHEELLARGGIYAQAFLLQAARFAPDSGVPDPGPAS
jgi:ATP-binding cassette subfamily B protein